MLSIPVYSNYIQNKRLLSKDLRCFLFEWSVWTLIYELGPLPNIICLPDDIQKVMSSFKPPNNPMKWYYYQSNFAGEKIEACRC